MLGVVAQAVIPVFVRRRQEDHYEFEVSLDCIVTTSLKQPKIKASSSKDS